jgi:hypothetical protein
MLIYRLEHQESGLGPFQHTSYSTNIDLLDAIRPLIDDLVSYPSPDEDSVKHPKDILKFKEVKQDMEDAYHCLHKDRPWKFGFQSKTEFHKWFHNGLLKKLHFFGFNLVVLETDPTNVLELKRQCIILDKDKTSIHSKQNLISLIG